MNKNFFGGGHQEQHSNPITALKMLLFLLASIIIGTLIMVIVYLFPTSSIKDNISESMDVLIEEDHYPYLIEGYSSFRLDNFTDVIMLNTAMYDGTESAVYKAMLNPRYAYTDKSMIESLNMAMKGDPDFKISKYPRYWHGYLVFLKPMLTFLNYKEIKILNLYIQYILVLIDLLLIYEKKGKKYALALAITVLVMNPIAISLSMQFSSVYYITLTSILVLIKYDTWFMKNEERLPYLFMFSGIMIAFFDLLTYPITACGLLLITYLMVFEENWKRQLVKVLSYTASWFLGYIGMWSGKWIMSWILTGYNTLENALAKVLIRTGSSVNNEKVTLLDSIYSNLKELINVPVFCLAFAVCFLIVWDIFYRKVRIEIKKIVVVIPTMIVSIYPFIWYGFIKNHSVIHGWYAYRGLAVFVCGLLCSMAKILEEE